MARRLTDKQKAFVENYLETLNATEAARRAKYKGSYDTLRAIASQNLTKPAIREVIDRRLREMTMSANEVLFNLSLMAKGVDATEFIELVEMFEVDEDGKSMLTGMSLKVDLEKIRRLGIGHLIKKISQTSNGIMIEWWSREKALELLGKYHKLFTDVQKHEGEITHIEMTLDEWKKKQAERRQTVASTIAMFEDEDA